MLLIGNIDSTFLWCSAPRWLVHFQCWKFLARSSCGHGCDTCLTTDCDKGPLLPTWCLGGGNQISNPTNSYLSRGVLFKHVPGTQKEGSQRPAINLKHLYKFVKSEHFKMEGLNNINISLYSMYLITKLQELWLVRQLELQALVFSVLLFEKNNVNNNYLF